MHTLTLTFTHKLNRNEHPLLSHSLGFAGMVSTGPRFCVNLFENSTQFI